MKKIAIIGKNENFEIFSIFGAVTFITSSSEEASQLLDDIAPKFAIILIEDSIFAAIQKSILKYELSKFPAISPIPNSSSYESNFSVNSSEEYYIFNKIKKITGNLNFANRSED